ncbi:MAG: hypothetical protein U0232_12970 [Thermomicrobiales bacterium]
MQQIAAEAAEDRLAGLDEYPAIVRVEMRHPGPPRDDCPHASAPSEAQQALRVLRDARPGPGNAPSGAPDAAGAERPGTSGLPAQAIVGGASPRVPQETIGDIDPLHLGLVGRALLRRPVAMHVRVVRAGEAAVRGRHLLGGRIRRDAEDDIGIGAPRASLDRLALGAALLLLLPALLGLPLGAALRPRDPRGPALRFRPALARSLGRATCLVLGTLWCAPRLRRCGSGALPTALFLPQLRLLALRIGGSLLLGTRGGGAFAGGLVFRAALACSAARRSSAWRWRSRRSAFAAFLVFRREGDGGLAAVLGRGSPWCPRRRGPSPPREPAAGIVFADPRRRCPVRWPPPSARLPFHARIT